MGEARATPGLIQFEGERERREGQRRRERRNERDERVSREERRKG